MFNFFLEFIKNPIGVGAIAPSSIFLINKMLGQIDFENDLIIVELGAGNGNFTREILSRMSAKSKLYVFENNEKFVKDLNGINDDRLEVFCCCATKIGERINGNKADVVLSGLPLGSLRKISDTLVLDILKAVRANLKQGGIYLQFQYFLSNKKDIQEVFGSYKLFFELINIPPAFVYKSIKQ